LSGSAVIRRMANLTDNIDENYIGTNGVKNDDVPLKEMNSTLNVEEQDGNKHKPTRMSVDENDELTPPEKPSISTILSEPMDHLSIIIFGGCGCFGFIGFIIAIAGMESVGKWIAICLCVLGIWASYEIRQLAALKKELTELATVRKELKEAVEKLDGQVAEFDQKNEEFRLETKNLQEANDEFEGEIEELQQTSLELTRTKDEFEHRNEQLDVELQKYQETNDSLGGTLQSLKEKSDHLEGTLVQFQELQGSIQRYAEKNQIDMSGALEKQQEMFDTLKTVMDDSANALLTQVAADLEEVDGEAGMTKEEFNKWLNRIPARFRQQMEEKGISFEKYANRNTEEDADGGEDKDVILDFEEMAQMVEDLLKENQQSNI